MSKYKTVMQKNRRAAFALGITVAEYRHRACLAEGESEAGEEAAMIHPAQQQALDDYAVEVAKAQVEYYQRVVEIVTEAVEHGDPIILTRTLRRAIGV